MATELDQNFCGWPHQELLRQDDSQDAVITQMLDQGSISFGRYTVDSLAWEKRSVFTHNRCQEELEKLKAPGLVAQKKAYFEAYYKRLRTLKDLQANKQTELIEDYGGDDSGSCKNVELEDENLQHGNLRNVDTNVSAGLSEAHVAEAAFGMESSGALSCKCSDFLTGNIDGDANSMNSHLSDDMNREPADCSTATFKENDTNKNSTVSLHYEPHREMSISYDELRTDIEDAMLKENCSNALQMGHMSKESTVLDSPRRIEEIELLKGMCSDDDAWNLKEAHVAESSVDGRARAAVDGADPPFFKVIPKILAVDNHITGEAKVIWNKQNSHSLTRRIKSTTLNTHAADSLKAAGIEKKREIPKAASILKKHTAVPRARDGLPQRSETRSINLPAVKEHSLASRAGCGLKGDRPNEGKTEARPRLIEGTSKIAAAPLTRTRTNPGKQQASARTGRLLLDGNQTSDLHFGMQASGKTMAMTRQTRTMT